MPETPREPSLSESRRKNFLFIVLAIMLGMLGYDYRIARPSVDRAYQKIAQRNDEVNGSPNRSLTNIQIQELITKSPSRTFLDGRDLVEVYSWRSGLPVRTHDLFAVYKESIYGEQVFYRQAKFVYETSVDVAPISVPTLVEMSPERLADFERDLDASMKHDAEEAAMATELRQRGAAQQEAASE